MNKDESNYGSEYTLSGKLRKKSPHAENEHIFSSIHCIDGKGWLSHIGFTCRNIQVKIWKSL